VDVVDGGGDDGQQVVSAKPQSLPLQQK